MKVLYVSGDGDFSALDFENKGYDKIDKLRELWDEANRSESKQVAIGIEEDYYIYGQSYEFGEVDDKWIDFIQDKFMDYDDLKHHNYYIVY
jgi:putative salt-induced outer membrane protein YdiY